MKNALVCAGLLFAGVLSQQFAFGQSASLTVTSGKETVTITEPAILSLERVFKTADLVAVVRIIAGDTENYNTAIYKAVVVTSFKGTANGQTIYFGPYDGGKLGWEYVVFLRNAKELAVPKTNPTAAFGAVKYMEIFNQGYTEMETSYECKFDGRNINEMCDYAVRICTDYITLPKKTPTAPPMKDATDFGCRFVRKSKFISLLDDLAEEPGVLQLPASAR